MFITTCLKTFSLLNKRAQARVVNNCKVNINKKCEELTFGNCYNNNCDQIENTSFSPVKDLYIDYILPMVVRVTITK